MTAPKKPKPAEVVELVDGAELLDQVEAAICAYVVLPTDPTATAVVLWIAATHAMPAWNTAPEAGHQGTGEAVRQVPAAGPGRGAVPPADPDRERLPVGGLSVHR